MCGVYMLSDDKCDEFRRLPGTFNTMIRAVHDDGKKQALQAAISEFCTVRWYDGDILIDRKDTALSEIWTLWTSPDN